LGAIELGAALAMGLMGSVHCVTMCGGLAGVLSSGHAPGRAAKGFITTHAGRLTTYAILGALAGAVGSAAHSVLPIEAVQLGARVLVAATLLAVGLYLIGIFRGLGRIELLGGRLLKPVRNALGKASSATSAASYVRGAVWGLIPCGLVYGAVGLAIATSATAQHPIMNGALTLLLFGLGTLPALFLVTGFAKTLSHWMRHARIRAAAGVLVCLSGAVQLTLAAVEVGAFDWPSIAGEKPCCARRHALEVARDLHREP
jgi:uncharacterized protein